MINLKQTNKMVTMVAVVAIIKAIAAIVLYNWQQFSSFVYLPS